MITGQKDWTSLGQWADHGILLPNTDPDTPTHLGITYFAFPEMTGRADVVATDAAALDHETWPSCATATPSA